MVEFVQGGGVLDKMCAQLLRNVINSGEMCQLSSLVPYVTRYEKIDHLQFFYEIRIFGIDRRRIFCRVQQSKNQALKGS